MSFLVNLSAFKQDIRKLHYHRYGFDLYKDKFKNVYEDLL